MGPSWTEGSHALPLESRRGVGGFRVVLGLTLSGLVLGGFGGGGGFWGVWGGFWSWVFRGLRFAGLRGMRAVAREFRKVLVFEVFRRA